MSPLTRRSSRIKYLLTPMYELLQRELREMRITSTLGAVVNILYFHLTRVNYMMMRIWHYLPWSICVTLCVTSHQWLPLVVVVAVVVVDAKSCCCYIRGSIDQSEARYSVYWPIRGPGSVTWAVTRHSRSLTSPAGFGQGPTWRDTREGVSILHNHTKIIR